MATKTAGTATTSSLTALQWQRSASLITDKATINELIKNPSVNVSPLSSAWIENDTLFIPGRDGNILHVKPGDWVMVDGAGWPIVVPGSIFATSWVHS